MERQTDRRKGRERERRKERRREREERGEEGENRPLPGHPTGPVYQPGFFGERFVLRNWLKWGWRVWHL